MPHLKISTVIVILLILTAYYMTLLLLWSLERQPVTIKISNTQLLENRQDVGHTFQEEIKSGVNSLHEEGLKNDTSIDFCQILEHDLDWKMSSLEPLVTLDPNRFMYTAIINGPSNELMGLQEAIFVAIKTNRTLVVPPFKPHFKDKDRGTAGLVPTGMRVDVQMISRLISVATIKDMKRKCDSRFDIGFQTKKVACGFERYVNKTCGMLLESRYSSLIKKDREYETIRYRKSKNCTTTVSLPIRRIPVSGMHPDMVRTKYIYNKEWKFSYCNPDRTRLQFCRKLERMESSDLASATLLLTKDYIENMHPNFYKSKCLKSVVVNVYLAFATDDHVIVSALVKQQSLDKSFQNDFLNKLFLEKNKSKLARFKDDKCWRIRVFNKVDLMQFLVENYPKRKCSVIWRDTHELISLIENELCRKSTVFAYSPSSSWSGVALQTRWNESKHSNIAIWKVLDELQK
uniref:uncharacterized protein LOC120341245 isoform X3 n=1 Tax=Styela clava TaxID=7725 RepID=UPI0019397E18|nr:uncharacterized protein LOC120341245 isoform X3 [Styela clava]